MKCSICLDEKDDWEIDGGKPVCVQCLGEIKRHALARLCAELDAAREEVRRLREALPPFAHDDLCELLGGNILGDASIVFVRNGATLTIGDFKRARSALATRASG